MNVLVTITFNAMKDDILEPFFACMRAQRDQDFLLLVIDNASGDGTPDYLRGVAFPNLRLILNPQNVGFGRACNQGIAFARAKGADHVTFINNDTEFNDDLIGDMVASLETTDAAGLSPLVTYYDEPRPIWFVTGSFRWLRGMIPYHDLIMHPRADIPRERLLPTAFAPGCCLLFRMSTFDVVPGFDDQYFVYWEDVDLCRMLTEHGLRIVVDTTLECRHKVSVSTGGAFSDFSLHHLNRGHMIFVRKHFGILALLYVIPVVTLKAVGWIARGSMRFSQVPVWWRGVVSGLRA